MAEPHSYIALDWVTGEIEDTLKQARQSLEAYVTNRDDVTKLRFCLTYAHQAHGSLKMIELQGATLLAAEVEQLAQLLVNANGSENEDSLELLMAGLLQLSDYLQKVQDVRQDQPASLLTLINEIRHVTGVEPLTTVELFESNLDTISQNKTLLRQPAIEHEEFNLLIRKLRQGFQAAMVGIVRDQELETNYSQLLKVCAHLHKVSDKTASESLWRISHGVLDVLHQQAISADKNIKTALKDIEHEIKVLLDMGRDALEIEPEHSLLKRLLYTIARSESSSELVQSLQRDYHLKEALVDPDEKMSSAPDSSAIRAVSNAINEELIQIQEMLENFALGSIDLSELKDIAPIYERLIKTMTVLEATSSLDIIKKQWQRINSMLHGESTADLDQLVDIAAQMLSVQNYFVNAKQLDNSKQIESSQIDQAYETVIREARNGLEDTKEAIVEFVASKWNTQTLKNVPSLLEEIHGGLTMIPLPKAAAILLSCQSFIREQLLSNSDIPEWRTLDTLADAITSVEYYLECLASSSDVDMHSILSVAEESVEALGYALDLDSISDIEEQLTLSQMGNKGYESASFEQESRPKANIIDLPVHQATLENKGLEPDPELKDQAIAANAPKEQNDIQSKQVSTDAVQEDQLMAQESVSAGITDEDDLVDDEIIEIFVEEAEEVLITLNEQLPIFEKNMADKEALGELRRAFHTLKGSGRMVGATVIGELAWSIENMLNRMIEGSQEANNYQLEITSKVISIIPELVADFEAKNTFNIVPVNDLITAANKASGIEAAKVFPVTDGPEASSTKTIVPPAVELESKSAPPASADELTTEVGEETVQHDETIDDELLSIFSAETIAHLKVIQEFIADTQVSNEELELSEELQRALHTLKGSAAMAEIWPISTIVNPLETLVKDLRISHQQASPQVIELLKSASHLITAGLEATASPLQELSGTGEFLTSIEQLREGKLANFDGAAQEGVAENLAMLFEGGMEQLLHASDKLSLWSDSRAPIARKIGSELIGDLHSLGDIAKDAGQAQMATLAIALSEVYQAAIDHPKQIRKPFFRLAEQVHESLIDMMDSLALGQNVSPALALVDQLQTMKQSLLIRESKPARVQAKPLDELPIAETITTVLEDLDEETLQIFAEEASDLIDELDASVAQWLSHREDATPKDLLMRALHTLKGGARLTGITMIADLTHNFETFLEGTKTYNDNFFEQLQAQYDRLQNTVAALFGGGFQRLAQTAAQQVSNVDSMGDLNSEVDAEVLEIFLEESQELIEAIEDAVLAWIGDRNDLSHIDELKRLLHTLKGGARLAGIRSIGDLSHEFESLVLQNEDNNTLKDDEFTEQLRSYQDQLTIEVAQVAASLTSKSSVEDTQEEETSELLICKKSRGEKQVTQAAIDATRAFIESFERDKTQVRGPQEVIKVPVDLLETLVNLAGETSISRSRVEQQMTGLTFGIDDMEATLDRLKGQLRRLDIETQAQILFRQEQVESEGMDSFDPLEMDRYSHLQQLSRSLIESASDLQDFKDTFSNKLRDMETLLIQQSRINTELQEGLMHSQMVPFSRLVPRLRRIVRQVSVELDKEVEFRLANIEGELDRTVLERMVAPLEHMLRNAVDHGIEPKDERLAAGKTTEGNITLGLAREGGEVVLTLSDDGGGINIDAVRAKAIEQGLMVKGANYSDHEILQFILQAGFSTAQSVTQLSGRGVGLDVVHSEIKQLGGSMNIQSVRGKGTHFIIRLPFTVSVNRALMVNIGQDNYAIPLNTIEGIVRVSPYELEAYYSPDPPAFDYAGQSYQLRYMGTLLHADTKAKLEGQTMPLPVILVRSKEHSVAIQVDRLLGSREIVVKTLGPQFSMVEGLSGATVLGDGSVVVIIDLLALIRADISHGHRDELLDKTKLVGKIEDEANLIVMVVDDSVTVRKVTSRFLERQGMDVILAKDGLDAVTILQEVDVLPDVMLLDIEMPRMDGFEVASRVRHNQRLKDIPIIMITSRTGEKHRERALTLGVNDYLGKPYQEGELLENIFRLTGRAQD